MKIKKYGWEGVVEQAERTLDRAKYFTKLVLEHPNCVLINNPETYNICF